MNQQQQQQQQYDPMIEFQAGVTAVLRSWSALRTAVETGWGGGERECQKKAEDLRRNIFEIMNGRKCPVPNFEIYDLSDNLAIFIEEEFSVTLEDESERQIAETIFQMYEECCNGNPTLARQMVTHANSAVAMNSQYPVKLITGEHDDDDSDDEMGTPATAAAAAAPIQEQQQQQQQQQNLAMLNPVDYISQPLFGKPIYQPNHPVQPSRQLGETTIQEDTPVEMDEDGFAPVQKGNRRR